MTILLPARHQSGNGPARRRGRGRGPAWRRSGIVALSLALGTTIAACSVGVGYEPAGTPLEFSATFSISPDGVVSIEGSVGIITDLGVFSVHAGVQIPVNPQPDQTILTVRHWRAGRLVASVYAINSGEQVVVTLNGHSVVGVSNQRVSISVAQGSSATIRVDSAPVSLAASQLRAGYCLRGANMRLNTDDPWPAEVTGVPCDEVHTAEVYYLWNPPAGEKYPGAREIADQGASACNRAFRAYVGLPVAKSKFSVASVYPDSSDWSSGDRTVDCILYWPTRAQPAGAALTGSARGSVQ